MGMFRLFSCDKSGSVRTILPSTRTAPNPNPFRFTITSITKFGEYDVVTVHYPDCTSYAGKKVLVVKNKDLSKLAQIDPHFLETQPWLIARVAPTEDGYYHAFKMLEALSNKQ